MATSKQLKPGEVDIKGKVYLTVALRVSNFRDACPDWSILTEIHAVDDAVVIMKASILNAEGRVIGTGYAEERRDASQINRTSALENCETSAIGRALAACGYGGTEYASANEVENAIHQQRSTSVTAVVLEQTPTAQLDKDELDRSEILLRKAIHLAATDPALAKETMQEAVFALDAEHKLALWTRLDSVERRTLKGLGNF